MPHLFTYKYVSISSTPAHLFSYFFPRIITSKRTSAYDSNRVESNFDSIFSHRGTALMPYLSTYKYFLVKISYRWIILYTTPANRPPVRSHNRHRSSIRGARKTHRKYFLWFFGHENGEQWQQQQQRCTIKDDFG